MASSDNLANLARAGLLKLEPTSKLELAGFLSAAADYLSDAGREGIASLTRFQLAYSAAHALALAAMRAHGYRPGQGKGHRAVVFQSLAHTVDAPANLWRTLDKAHGKRNASEYEGIVDVSESEANDILRLAGTLHELVLARLKSRFPDLL